MKEKIAIVGGTGAMGTGLGYRLAKAGYPVCVGSRDAARAGQSAAKLGSRIPGITVHGASNDDAAAFADIILVTVPYAHHQTTVTEISSAAQGKLVIDATVPLRPPKVGSVQLPESGCAAVECQKILGPNVDVVAAFQNVGASHLDSDDPVDCDVLISGDKVSARERVLGLVEAMGMQGWHAGPLVNSAAAEALTSVLIQINKRYKCPAAGIRITSGQQHQGLNGDEDHVGVVTR